MVAILWWLLLRDFKTIGRNRTPRIKTDFADKIQKFMLANIAGMIPIIRSSLGASNQCTSQGLLCYINFRQQYTH